MVRLINHLAGQPWVHVAFGFMLMGSWAIYANWGHAMPRPLIAGLVQGMISGASTYGLKRLLDALRGRMTPARGWWVPPILACAGSLCLLVAIHSIAQTPEVLRTISVPFCVATLYAVSYNFIMWKKEPLP